MYVEVTCRVHASRFSVRGSQLTLRSALACTTFALADGGIDLASLPASRSRLGAQASSLFCLLLCFRSCLKTYISVLLHCVGVCFQYLFKDFASSGVQAAPSPLLNLVVSS